MERQPFLAMMWMQKVTQVKKKAILMATLLTTGFKEVYLSDWIFDMRYSREKNFL